MMTYIPYELVDQYLGKSAYIQIHGAYLCMRFHFRLQNVAQLRYMEWTNDWSYQN